MRVFLQYSKGKLTGKHMIEVSNAEAAIIKNVFTFYVENMKDKSVKRSQAYKITKWLLKTMNENFHFL